MSSVFDVDVRTDEVSHVLRLHAWKKCSLVFNEDL